MNKITIAKDGTITIECETGTSVTRTESEDGTTFKFMNDPPASDPVTVAFSWNGVDSKVALIKAVREAAKQGGEIVIGIGAAKALVEASISSPQTFQCGSYERATLFIATVNKSFGMARLA